MERVKSRLYSLQQLQCRKTNECHRTFTSEARWIARKEDRSQGHTLRETAGGSS
jgi:hypothetical protein